VIEKLEAALAVKAAENLRLRRVEAAASAALAELDAMIGDSDTPVDRRQATGRPG
jgi:hypothetical protein